MSLASTLSTSLGLTDKEARAYLALLEAGTSTVKPIADRAGIKRTSIYNFIENLIERGFVTKTVIRGRKHYQAIPPEKLIEIARHQAAQVEQCMPELEALSKHTSDKIRVSYFQGAEETKNIVKEETKCKKLARYIWPGRETLQMVGGAEHMTDIDRERIKRGVSIQAIRFKQKDVPFATSAHGEKYLRQIRFAPPFFNASMAMGIYDTGKVSFFSSNKEGFGVLIESEELVELMNFFFQMLWKSCIPAKEDQG